MWTPPLGRSGGEWTNTGMVKIFVEFRLQPQHQYEYEECCVMRGHWRAYI
jgi:hypothetical protein